MNIVSAKNGFGGFSKVGVQKKRYDCGGCDGLIHFEYKKEKGFATLQMKLLEEAEEKRKKNHLNKFFGVLRSLPIFKPLDDDALVDLTLLLELKTLPVDRIIVKSGSPGNYLYILLKGSVAIKSDDGAKIAELATGEVFGEMSLLSGEPVAHTIQTIEATHVAMLSTKNFKQVIVKYPILQIFLFRMLLDHLQSMTLKSGNISSGMTGELSEISAIDLFQLINSSQKTGAIELMLENGKGIVFFRKGQVVYARFFKLRDKDALFTLLEAKKGRFSYTKELPKELENRPPIGDFMGMLMEAVQRIDERQE